MENLRVGLLKACLELLKRQKNAYEVLDILSETVHYDEEDCDGYCLMEDICMELNLDLED